MEIICVYKQKNLNMNKKKLFMLIRSKKVQLIEYNCLVKERKMRKIENVINKIFLRNVFGFVIIIIIIN